MTGVGTGEVVNQRLRDCNEVDGEKHAVDSRDKVKHMITYLLTYMERNNQLFITRMM